MAPSPAAGAPAEPNDAPPPLPAVDPGATLAERLASITAHVTGVAKAGRNDHFGYSYQRAEDVAAAISPLLGHYAVSIMPTVDLAAMRIEETGRATRSGAATMLYIVPMTFTLSCPVGEPMVQGWVALANDDADKGVNKAITAGLKSFLRAAFLIPTDESDTDSTQGSKASAESVTGELPDLSDATVNGRVVILGEGTVGLAYDINPRDTQAEVNALVKGLGGRWQKDGKLWAMPPKNTAAAVTLARALGLTIPAKVAERYPVVEEPEQGSGEGGGDLPTGGTQSDADRRAAEEAGDTAFGGQQTLGGNSAPTTDPPDA